MGLSVGDQTLSLSGEHMLTDCTHCGATFRVTPAQLGASGGRVRCGLCSQVFDGFVRLRSEPDAIPPAAAAPSEPSEPSEPPNDEAADILAAAARGDPSEATPVSTPDSGTGTLSTPPAQDPTDVSAVDDPVSDETSLAADEPTSVGRVSPPEDTLPISEAAAAAESVPETADAEIELTFDAADAAELDGTLTDIEIPTDLPPVEPEEGIGADALAAIRSAAEPMPEPGSEERAVLEDTLTDIEIPTELLELTVVDDDEVPGAPSSRVPASAARDTTAGDTDTTGVGDPEPAPAESRIPESASPQDSPTDETLPSSPPRGLDQRVPASETDGLVTSSGTEGRTPADVEVIPGFPGFVPDDTSVSVAASSATAALQLPTAASKNRAARMAMGFATALLALLLPVQGTLLFRDALADRFPAMHPLLDGLCRQAGCRVPLPRRPDKLEIETSDLRALDPTRPNRVVLVASLRNLASITQAYPQLELTLTDPADHPLARRVFEPTHYLPESVAPDAGFAPRGEVSVRLQLDTGSVTPSGYRLFLFHR